MKKVPSRLPRRLFFAALPALLAACSALDLLNATAATTTYSRTEGIACGPADGAKERHKLDVYQPVGSVKNAPLVVFFYGGSWTSGARGDYRFASEVPPCQGIVAIAADYRLRPAVRYPVFVQDSALALRWGFDNAALLGANPAKVFVMGHRAGAYNAAMLALDPRWLAAVELSPAQLAGWIGLAGPYDFLPIGDKTPQVAFS